MRASARLGLASLAIIATVACGQDGGRNTDGPARDAGTGSAHDAAHDARVSLDAGSIRYQSRQGNRSRSASSTLGARTRLSWITLPSDGRIPALELD